MKPEVEVVRFIFEGEPRRVDRRKVSSAVWKNLYTLTERGESLNDFVLIKRRMQDFFLTFSELIQVGEREYTMYFMTPSSTGRLDIVRAMKNGLKIGKKRLEVADVEFIRYGVRPDDFYVTLSPIVVVRDGDYYLPPEMDFFRNLLGYLEIKYQYFTRGERINLRKDNFRLDPLYTRPVKINFQKRVIYGVHMGFRLRVSGEYLGVAATLIQLGFGSRTGMGYGFVVPKRIVKREEIEFIVRHPKFWESKKTCGVM